MIKIVKLKKRVRSKNFYAVGIELHRYASTHQHWKKGVLVKDNISDHTDVKLLNGTVRRRWGETHYAWVSTSLVTPVCTTESGINCGKLSTCEYRFLCLTADKEINEE